MELLIKILLSLLIYTVIGRGVYLSSLLLSAKAQEETGKKEDTPQKGCLASKIAAAASTRI